MKPHRSKVIIGVVLTVIALAAIVQSVVWQHEKAREENEAEKLAWDTEAARVA